MAALRDNAQILDLVGLRNVEASFVTLTADLAKREIDEHWWKMPVDLSVSEEDRHWKWHDLCRSHQASDYAEAVAIMTPDGRIQGAMIYRIDGMSALELGAGSVYVDRLSTAPWNRRTVTPVPLYSRVGTRLIHRAAHHSHLLAFAGRVNLTTLPNATGFYERLGFVNTGRLIESLALLELPSADARTMLANEGLVPHATIVTTD